jgi:hypothetical protein
MGSARLKGGGRVMSKKSMRRITLGAVALSTILVLGSSIYVYALAGGYNFITETDNFTVYLRIDKINANPQKFTLIQTSVKITSKSTSDIMVLEFKVKAYSAPPNSLGSKKFGEESVYNLLIPAMGTLVVKLNVKIYNYTDLKQADFVYVHSTIRWIHFGEYYERMDATRIDIRPYKLLLPA